MSTLLHIDHLLQDYLDGTLPPEQRRAVEQHLATCATCRMERDAYEALAVSISSLPKALEPPQDLWGSIAARLEHRSTETPLIQLNQHPTRVTARLSREPATRITRRHRWTLAGSALAACIAIGLVFWLFLRLNTPAWEVVRLEGSPRVGSAPFSDKSRVQQGQWIETDNQSRATLDVGMIGNVEIAPNTRVQLLEAQPTDHRLNLEEGTIHARIWAPPRLFFVETPSALAVDLGCAYTLTVDSTGGSLLHVTAGYVAMEHERRSTVVPAGSMCYTRPGLGPGTPFRAEASQSFRTALSRLDFEQAGSEELTTLLQEATSQDATTLWHLLSVVDSTEQARVYDQLVSLVTPPEGVTRAGVLRGDRDMIAAWRIHLGLDLDTSWILWNPKKKPKAN